MDERFEDQLIARIAALEAELAEARDERDGSEFLDHAVLARKLRAAEARATAAEARAEKLAEALEPFVAIATAIADAALGRPE